MVGEIWQDIPGHEHRERCSTWNDTETMNHILLECNSSARITIWEQAGEIWPHGRRSWPAITMCTILGIGSINSQPDVPAENNIQHNSKTETRGKTGLLQILILEASHLIWTLRCERTIQKKQHAPEEIRRRWAKAIHSRITTDRIQATKIRREKKFSRIAKATWNRVLQERSRFF